MVQKNFWDGNVWVLWSLSVKTFHMIKFSVSCYTKLYCFADNLLTQVLLTLKYRSDIETEVTVETVATEMTEVTEVVTLI